MAQTSSFDITTGVDLQEHRQTVRQGSKRITHVYRWLTEVPMRGTADAVTVNWFSVEILNGSGKRTYYNSFITDLPVTADSVAELAACGRARWKIENETFNVLKTNGYNLEHNFGHGKQTLSSLLVSLNLLAFAFHTVANLCVRAWSTAVAARGAKYRFFEHPTDHSVLPTAATCTLTGFQARPPLPDALGAVPPSTFRDLLDASRERTLHSFRTTNTDAVSVIATAAVLIQNLSGSPLQVDLQIERDRQPPTDRVHGNVVHG